MERAALAVVAGGWRCRAPRAMGAREAWRSSSDSGGAAPRCCRMFNAYTAASYTCSGHNSVAECWNVSSVAR
eukprot:3320046-Pyramimonas_sp.AAC.1